MQGVDDNASGLGVMLELAQALSQTPLHYGVRFVALSAGEASTGAFSAVSGPESSEQGDREYSKDDTAFLLSGLSMRELLSIVAKDDHWRTQ